MFDQRKNHLRHQRGAEHLHALGPVAIAGFLIDLDLRIGCGADIDALLAEFRHRISLPMKAIAGDRFPPRVLREVPGQ